jgi:hypothetical protein
VKKRHQERMKDPAYRQKKKEQAAAWRAKNKPKHTEYLRERKRKQSGVGAIPDPDEILFYGYKEPLRPFKEGHGYEGVLIFSKGQDKIQCHFCGGMFKTLAAHLKMHGLTATEYREKTKLAASTALVGEGTRLRIVEGIKRTPEQIEAAKENLAKANKKLKGMERDKGKRVRGMKFLPLETKNKRGTCPDQLLDIIDKTIKSYGRVPSKTEFLSFHNGKYMGSIRYTYGTWENALKKLGERSLRHHYTDNDLLDAMRNFHKVHKRTPRYSDHQRGLLPSANTYYSRFKTLNNARLKANVPLVIQVSRKNYEEWTPTEEERGQMLDRLKSGTGAPKRKQV